MKETSVILRTLFKRMMYRKGLIFCFLLMPVLILSMQALEKGGDTGVRAGIYMEEENEWNQKLSELLTESEGEIQFVQYPDLDKLQQDIVSGRIECGYILQEDLQNRMEQKKWNNSVIVYESAQSMLTPVVNEAFFQQLFTLVSGEWFEGYIANHEDYADIDRKELVTEIRMALKKQMEDGKTFYVEHYYINTQADDNTDRQEEAQVFPVRGVAAVMVFLCGLLGIFDCIADRKEGPFLRKRRGLVLFLNLGLPVCLSAVIALFTLFFAGKCRGMVEIPVMFVYSIFVIIWCLFFSLFIRSEKALAAVLPVLILCSLFLAPVFLDLSSFLPVFGILEKLIPVTYYLRMG